MIEPGLKKAICGMAVGKHTPTRSSGIGRGVSGMGVRNRGKVSCWTTRPV